MSELQAVVHDLFAALDRKDFASVRGMFGDDAQGVDEISRRWLRSKDELDDYFRQLEPAIQNLRSELRDVHEIAWGDSGLVTCWLEQDYVLNDQPQHVSAPTSIGLHRESGNWQIVLVHSIPLPEASSG